MRLEGKVALITGGGSGMGKVAAELFAREGASVVLTDVNDAAGGATADAIGERGLFVHADISDEADARTMVEAAVDRFGRLDVLYNNAGVMPEADHSVIDTDVDTWDKVMAVNLRGPFLMVKHVAPHMTAQGYGKIINIGSGTAFRGIPWMLHYVTTKGGIMAMTRALARELGEHGIRVNTLAPGFTLSDTVMSENPGHVETARDRAIQSRSLRRDEHPQDLLGALVFLASADSDFITGQTIAVDGGNVNT
jgi:NAD(P)-dependent dehydrogenase (short-subunit alcohol dehydrogenase family)